MILMFEWSSYLTVLSVYSVSAVLWNLIAGRIFIVFLGFSIVKFGTRVDSEVTCWNLLRSVNMLVLFHWFDFGCIKILPTVNNIHSSVKVAGSCLKGGTRWIWVDSITGLHKIWFQESAYTLSRLQHCSGMLRLCTSEIDSSGQSVNEWFYR